jgi:hypothetical protein
MVLFDFEMTDDSAAMARGVRGTLLPLVMLEGGPPSADPLIICDRDPLAVMSQLKPLKVEARGVWAVVRSELALSQDSW